MKNGEAEPEALITDPTDLVLRGLQIVWINLLLSCDNAVVIALACRDLDRRRRLWAITGGSAVAIALRFILTFFVVELLDLPFLKLLCGLLLFWIAFDLLRDAGAERAIDAAGSIWGAVRTIAVADAVMSLDNVVAVAAAAKGSIQLIVFGIALTVPLIIFGSTLILAILNRFPILVVAGAALLGWVAGGMIASDPVVVRYLGWLPGGTEIWLQSLCAALVVVVAAALLVTRRRSARAEPLG